MPKQKAMLIDIKKCIGCGSCASACKQLHGFNTDPEPTLSDTAFTVIETRGDKFVRKVCMHCTDPACASVCPVGAIKKSALGPVVYDADKCIGCRYCMLACPYQVPRYQWSKLAPFIKKCDMCSERVLGRQPACLHGSVPGSSQRLRRSRRINRRGLEPHSLRLQLCAAYLRPAGSRGRKRAVRLRCGIREAGFQATPYRQPATSVAHRGCHGRLAQGGHHGRHHPLCLVLDHAAPPRSSFGRRQREVRHQ